MPESPPPNDRDPSVHPGADALNRLPSSRYLLTAAHGASRNGMLVSRVQHCADEPPVVAISVRKGHPLSPLIRDTARFGLAELHEGDRVLVRKFGAPVELQGEDPFLGHPLLPEEETFELPIPRGIAAWMSCELVRHLDIEADHELYVGRVLAGGVLEVTTRIEDEVAIDTGASDPQPPVAVNGRNGRNGRNGSANGKRASA